MRAQRSSNERPATGIEVPQGLDASLDAIVTHDFSGQEAKGTAFVFVLLTRPGALLDGSLDADDILAVDLRPFAVTP